MLSCRIRIVWNVLFHGVHAVFGMIMMSVLSHRNYACLCRSPTPRWDDPGMTLWVLMMVMVMVIMLFAPLLSRASHFHRSFDLFLARAALADMERNLMSRMHAQDKNRFRAVGLSSVLLLVSSMFE